MASDYPSRMLYYLVYAANKVHGPATVRPNSFDAIAELHKAVCLKPELAPFTQLLKRPEPS